MPDSNSFTPSKAGAYGRHQVYDKRSTAACGEQCCGGHHIPRHWFIRHGENSGHARSTLAAHSVVLSVWQAVHESGIFADWAVAGAMKRKVWACTLTSAMVGWIFGMWQPTHSLPAESGA